MSCTHPNHLCFIPLETCNSSFYSLIASQLCDKVLNLYSSSYVRICLLDILLGDSVETGSPRSRFARVIRVRPGLRIIRVWPGLDHVSHEIKKARYGSTMTAATAMFTSWATPTFRNNDFACCKCTGSPALYFFRAYACYNCDWLCKNWSYRWSQSYKFGIP